MTKGDLAYELSLYKRKEITQIVKAALSIKKYYKLTEEVKTLDEMVEEVEKEEK